jgi:ATP-dependent Lhr-like helicase
MLKWPSVSEADSTAGRGPTRTVGSQVILVNGALAAYIPRGARQITVFLPEDEPARSTIARALATRLARLARVEEGQTGLLVSEINGAPAPEHPFASFLTDAGFSPGAMGFQMRRHA